MFQLQDITYQRNDNLLFENLNFTLNSGQLLQVMGSNGVGKTSLLRIAAGLEQPTRGEVRWLGKNIKDNREDFHESLHFLGHRNGVKEDLTLRENLQLFAALAKKNLQSSMEEALTFFQLPLNPNIFANELSMGQHRRLALTKLVLLKACIWILDEPLTGLDSRGRVSVEKLMQEHLENGGIAVISSHHELKLLEKYAVKFPLPG